MGRGRGRGRGGRGGGSSTSNPHTGGTEPLRDQEDSVAGPHKRPRMVSKVKEVQTPPPISNVGKFKNDDQVVCVFGGKPYPASVLDVKTRVEIETMFPGVKSVQTSKKGKNQAEIDLWYAYLKDDTKKNELLYCIHYLNWGNKWNEWVPVDRLTALREEDLTNLKKYNPRKKAVAKTKSTITKNKINDLTTGTEASETDSTTIVVVEKVAGRGRKRKASSPDIVGNIRGRARRDVNAKEDVLRLPDFKPRQVVISADVSEPVQDNVSRKSAKMGKRAKPEEVTRSIKLAKLVKVSQSVKSDKVAQPFNPPSAVKATNSVKPDKAAKVVQPVNPLSAAKASNPVKPAISRKVSFPVKRAKSSTVTKPVKPARGVKVAKLMEPATAVKPVKPAKEIKVSKLIKPATAAKPIKPAKGVKVSKLIKPATAAKPVKPAKEVKVSKLIKPATAAKVSSPAKPAKAANVSEPFQLETASKLLKVIEVSKPAEKDTQLKVANHIPLEDRPLLISGAISVEEDSKHDVGNDKLLDGVKLVDEDTHLKNPNPVENIAPLDVAKSVEYETSLKVSNTGKNDALMDVDQPLTADTQLKVPIKNATLLDVAMPVEDKTPLKVSNTGENDALTDVDQPLTADTQLKVPMRLKNATLLDVAMPVEDETPLKVSNTGENDSLMDVAISVEDEIPLKVSNAGKNDSLMDIDQPLTTDTQLKASMHVKNVTLLDVAISVEDKIPMKVFNTGKNDALTDVDQPVTAETQLKVPMRVKNTTLLDVAMPVEDEAPLKVCTMLDVDKPLEDNTDTQLNVSNTAKNGTFIMFAVAKPGEHIPELVEDPLEVTEVAVNATGFGASKPVEVLLQWVPFDEQLKIAELAECGAPVARSQPVEYSTLTTDVAFQTEKQVEEVGAKPLVGVVALEGVQDLVATSKEVSIYVPKSEAKATPVVNATQPELVKSVEDDALPSQETLSPDVVLLSVLEYDYKQIKSNNMLIEIPAKVSVEDMLLDYVKSVYVSEDKVQGDRANLYCCGLREYFDASVEGWFLYIEELDTCTEYFRKQDFVELADQKGNSSFRGKKTPILAPIYMLRLISKCISSRLEELFKMKSIKPTNEILLEEKRKFMRYLAENKEKYLSGSVYYARTKA